MQFLRDSDTQCLLVEYINGIRSFTKIVEGRPEEDLQPYDRDSLFPFSHLSHPTLPCNTFLSLFFPQVSVSSPGSLSLTASSAGGRNFDIKETWL